jgi:IclR family transcriptional regulator, KDG regulon repressor
MSSKSSHRSLVHMPGDHYIELVGKTIAVLEALRDEPKGSGVQQLAERTGQGKSTTHRILQSLKRHGYVDQEGTGGLYRLGLKVLTLVRGVDGNAGLQQFARPYLQELTRVFDESSYLAVLRSGNGVFVEVQETHRDLRLVGPLGADVHFHATAAGKVIAAFLPIARQEHILNALPLGRFTSRTTTDPARVRKEWAAIRKQGYAFNNGETIVGAAFVAAPVLDAREHICGSISVGVPQPRYSIELGDRLALQLTDVCLKLSDTLKAAGYVHPHPFPPEVTQGAGRKKT